MTPSANPAFDSQGPCPQVAELITWTSEDIPQIRWEFEGESLPSQRTNSRLTVSQDLGEFLKSGMKKGGEVPICTPPPLLKE